MNLAMIVATDKNGGIGYKNQLPWHCPEDLKYFKEMTADAIVVMGMNTFRSLPMYPKGLPGRTNLVVCRDPSEQSVDDTNVKFVTVDEVLESEERGWVIGGANTYSTLKDNITTISHTVIEGEYETDLSIDITEYTEGKLEAESITLSDTAKVSLYIDKVVLQLIKEEAVKEMQDEVEDIS